MKILYVLATNRGGVPHYTAELANAVSKHAEVIVIKPEKTTADDIFSNNVKIVNAFKPLTLSFVDMYETKRVMKMLSPNNLINILSYRNIGIINTINPEESAEIESFLRNNGFNTHVQGHIVYGTKEVK